MAAHFFFKRSNKW